MEKIIARVENLIKDNQLEHYYLYHNLLLAHMNNWEANAKWLKGDDSSWIFGFCANNNYNLYGLNYTEELLNSVISEFDFEKLPDNLCLSGKKDIIDKILKANKNVSYTVYKDRFFYETNKNTFKSNENNELIVRTAEISDVAILAEMNCSFFEEEYDGENNKNLDEMKFDMQLLIADNKYIVGIYDEIIVGFCSRMDSKFENEMVGTLFIEKKYRNKKFGIALLSEMTKRILETNIKSWLMTDVKSIPSNKLVASLGYEKKFEYTSGQIKKL